MLEKKEKKRKERGEREREKKEYISIECLNFFLESLNE